MNNVIYKDESMYGFLSDIIGAFKQEEEPDEMVLDAIKEAQELLKEKGDGFYHVYSHAMGAWIFKELEKEFE